MQKKTLASRDGLVCYWTGGNQSDDSECLVFTHGMAADHTMFEKQVEYFDKEYSILTWDIPFQGESRPYQFFSYSNFAKQLDDILNKEGLNRVILVGQSMGGFVSQAFVELYPEKVKAFIGVDTTPFGHAYYSNWALYSLTKVGSISSLLPYGLLIKSIAKTGTVTELAYNNMYRSASKLSKQEIIFLMKKTFGEFVKQKQTVEFDCPVLLIIGDRDKVGGTKDINYVWADKINCPIRVIANASHNSNLDNYTEFNQRVANFLTTL